MSLTRTVSKINGDFSRKSQIFPTPVYFVLPLKGSLGIGYQRLGSKTRMMGLPGRERSFGDNYSHLDKILEPNGRTDGHQATAKDRDYA